MEPALITLLSGGLISVVTLLGFLFRKLTRDKLQISRDRAEGNLIGDLIKQRDDARQERDAINQQLIKIGQQAQKCMERVRELMAKEQQLRIQNAMLSNLLKRLAKTLDDSKAALEKSVQSN